jgi:hypothetical protein
MIPLKENIKLIVSRYENDFHTFPECSMVIPGNYYFHCKYISEYSIHFTKEYTRFFIRFLGISEGYTCGEEVMEYVQMKGVIDDLIKRKESYPVVYDFFKELYPELFYI